MEATWRWILVTAIAPVAWGATYPVTREFLPADVPLWGATIRALPAGLLLLLLCRRLPHGAWWWRAVVLGVLNTGAFFVLVYLAAQLLPSSVASVVMATSPVTMTLAAWVLLAQRPRPLVLVGAGVGVIGVAAMLLGGGETISWPGVAASIAALLMSSIGYVLATRWGGDVPVLASSAWQLVAGGVVLLPLAVAVEGRPPALTVGTALGFGYLSLVATALAFVAWFTGLRRLDAGRVGLIGLLNPVTGVGIGLALAGETLGIQQLVGLALTLGGLLVGLLGRRAPSRSPDTRLVADSR